MDTVPRKVKIWNDSDETYKEYFQDQLIEIPPRGYIIMSRSEGQNFLGRFRPFAEKRPDGTKVTTTKPLRRELIVDASDKKATEKEEKKVANKCMKCGFQAKSKAGLTAHARHCNVDAMTPDEGEAAMNAAAAKREAEELAGY